MSGNIGNLGAGHLPGNHALEARSEPAGGWTKPAKGLLQALALGLMLACGTAYASEPSSPAPAAMTKVSQPQPARNLASSNVGDTITDWTIAIFIIILGMFVSINVVDSRKRNREE
jgi:hypothetical protein